MDKELTFSINKDGQEINCIILSAIPGEYENESYVAFCYETEKNDGIQYAKIIKNDDIYIIEEFENQIIVDELMNKIIEIINKETFSYLESYYE